MGRIYEQRGSPASMRWFWSLYGMFGKPADMRTDGYAPTTTLSLSVDLTPSLAEAFSLSWRSGRRRAPPRNSLSALFLIRFPTSGALRFSGLPLPGECASICCLISLESERPYRGPNGFRLAALAVLFQPHHVVACCPALRLHPALPAVTRRQAAKRSRLGSRNQTRRLPADGPP